ncbi:hypothetical protein B0H34DRAFT_801122 [Crassisporium funariophilum]|nr:hypothetical protein B0H34DRAFT_801122 [Crassisporium funariophilum]
MTAQSTSKSPARQTLDSEEGKRLRLMTLLSLYDLLPHSISHPPTGTEPMTLQDAVSPEAVQRCLDVLSKSSQPSPHQPPKKLAKLVDEAKAGDFRPSERHSSTICEQSHCGLNKKSSRDWKQLQSVPSFSGLHDN